MKKPNNVVSIELYKVKRSGIAGVLSEMESVIEQRSASKKDDITDLPEPAHFHYHKRKRMEKSGY